jgi:5-deoxy-glucuronate isomerase
MHLKHPGPFARGYEPIVDRRGANADMLMDFGILTLGPGEDWDSGSSDEKALLLVAGEVEFSWPGGRARARRSSLLDETPSALHLPDGAEAGLKAGSRGAQLALIRTDNAAGFEPRFFEPRECRSEERGKGTMSETSTRLVRAVFDDSNAPRSNLVLGEVVGSPGKWSSYPPHHHPQPEIYHYRFLPENGFGFTTLGEDAYLLKDRDTVLIREGQVHPHVTAPGYAIWYIWVIRHLEGSRYRPPYPIFVEEHSWVMSPEADIWRPPSERGSHKEG